MSVTINHQTNSVEPSSGDLSIGGSDKVIIDSSGNLLVGVTSTTIPGIGNTTTGVSLRGGGNNSIAVSRDADIVGYFNRNTNDGGIVEFRKDGATVGSIGVGQSSDLYIGTSDTGILTSSSESITPWNPSTNAGRDDAIDLGTSDHRFQDLFLSGGVYLGGIGSANKLDDYEEGTWTPTDAASPAILTGLTNVNCYYRKIGDWVYLFGRFSWSSAASSATLIAIGGLPFADNSGGASPSCGTTMIASSTWNTSTSGNSATPHIPSGQAYLNFYSTISATYGAYSGSSATGATEVILQIAYKAT